MKAIVYERYGGPEQLEVRELDRPEPREGEILVRVHAVGLNGADAEMLTGSPLYARPTARGLLRPGVRVLGSDVAGVVEAIGPGVEGFVPGDAVIGELFEHFGALAEYVVAPAKLWIPKPEELGFVEASALPQAGVLALQGVQGHVEEGSDVLVIGAGGGVGVFAVQLAKQLGGTVVAVDNGHKEAVLRDLGVDRFVDYTREDVLADGRSYDLILDAISARTPGEYRRALKPGGTCQVVGGHVGRLLWILLYGLVLRLFSAKRMGLLMWDRSPENVGEIARRAAEGGLRAVIDGVYPLAEAPEAFRRLTERRAGGKVVVRVAEPPPAQDPG